MGIDSEIVPPSAFRASYSLACIQAATASSCKIFRVLLSHMINYVFRCNDRGRALQTRDQTRIHLQGCHHGTTVLRKSAQRTQYAHEDPNIFKLVADSLRGGNLIFCPCPRGLPMLIM